MKLGVSILTGGASSRMGQDKATLDWLRARAVDRLARLEWALGARELLIVGHTDYGLPFLADAVPLSGPVGGILAAGAALADRGCELMAVLAVDAPTIRPEDLWPLIAHGRPGAAYAGHHLPLTVDPRAMPRDPAADWPIARFIEACGLIRLPCPPQAARRIRGANTPAERQALLAELARYERATRTGVAL